MGAIFAAEWLVLFLAKKNEITFDVEKARSELNIEWVKSEVGETVREGIILIAFGPEFLLMAVHAALTAKSCTPGIKVAVVTNVGIKGVEIGKIDVFDHIGLVEGDSDVNRRFKISLEKFTPFEKSIYLDADVEVKKSLSPLFEILKHHPIAARPKVTATKWTFPMWEGRADRFGVCEYNTGVIGFDKSSPLVVDFFKRWRENYDSLGGFHDQGSFMRTVYAGEFFPIVPLSAVWNATAREGVDKKLVEKYPDRVIVHHYREVSKSKEVARNIKVTLSGMQVEYADTVRGKSAMPLLEEAKARFLSGRKGIKQRVTASRGKSDRYLNRAKKKRSRFSGVFLKALGRWVR